MSEKSKELIQQPDNRGLATLRPRRLVSTMAGYLETAYDKITPATPADRFEQLQARRRHMGRYANSDFAVLKDFQTGGDHRKEAEIAEAEVTLLQDLGAVSSKKIIGIRPIFPAGSLIEEEKIGFDQTATILAAEIEKRTGVVPIVQREPMDLDINDPYKSIDIALTDFERTVDIEDEDEELSYIAVMGGAVALKSFKSEGLRPEHMSRFGVAVLRDLNTQRIESTWVPKVVDSSQAELGAHFPEARLLN